MLIVSCVLNRTPDVYTMTVMVFESTTKNPNAQEFVDKYPRVVAAILIHRYIDDYLTSDESEEEEAAESISEVCYIHQSR